MVLPSEYLRVSISVLVGLGSDPARGVVGVADLAARGVGVGRQPLVRVVRVGGGLSGGVGHRGQQITGVAVGHRCRVRQGRLGQQSVGADRERRRASGGALDGREPAGRVGQGQPLTRLVHDGGELAAAGEGPPGVVGRRQDVVTGPLDQLGPRPGRGCVRPAAVPREHERRSVVRPVGGLSRRDGELRVERSRPASAQQARRGRRRRTGVVRGGLTGPCGRTTSGRTPSPHLRRARRPAHP